MGSPLERLIQESIKPLTQHSVYVGLSRTSDAGTEPVTLTEAKLQCRVESGVSEDDALITSLIIAARNYIEGVTSRSLITQTWELVLDTFPSAGEIKLYKEPILTITDVTTYDEDDASTVMSTSAYRFDKYRGRITLVDGYSWPSDLRSHNAVIITFTAGYGAAASNVPQAIKQAALLLVAHWYVNREAVVEESLAIIPVGVASLLSQYKLLRI